MHPPESRLNVDMESLQRALEEAEPKVLDGRRVSQALLDEISRDVSLLDSEGIVPHLAVVRVGDDPASEIYVRHKIRACESIGVQSSHIHLPGEISQTDLLARLDELNADADINGILLQLPLSGHHDAERAILSIAPKKDVDGFHPANLGFLMAGKGELEPCTPRGVITMMQAAGVECRGKRAVVVGRSMIVGRPMAQMLVRGDATVTVCHRHTGDLAGHVREADIVVVATGVPELVKGDWIKPGAVVIDVGISRTDSGKLIGDVEYDAARERASLITPVPGGVGPMTVATLMENTVRATCAQHALAIRGGEVVTGVDYVASPSLD